MRVECVNSVEQAIGRKITQQEQRGIEERVRSTMRRLASRDPQKWGAMPLPERMRETAKVIAQDIEHAAQLKEQRAAMQLNAHAKHVPDVEQSGAKGFQVIQRKLEQANAYVGGVHRQYWLQALDTMDFATRNDSGSLVARGVRWISNLENPEKVLAFVREVFKQDSGDAGASAAALAWSKTMDAMRERFNRAGGDVRKLLYGYLPQPHDVTRLTRAGIDGWVAEVRHLVDRGRYTDERGRPLNDAELGQVLEQAWKDITSDGLATAELGVYRAEGVLANAGSQARVLHFKDAESYVAYMGKFGEGTVYDAMSGHVRWMARNIALTETFGPNPAATFRTMHDTARLQGGKDRVAGIMTTQDMWDTLTGKFDNPHSQSLARLNQGIRSLQVAGKLGSAAIGAITDIPLHMMTLAYHRLPFWRVPFDMAAMAGSERARFADLGGLMADSAIGDIGRWGESHLGSAWPDMLASATMKASLLNAITDAGRRAFGMSMMAGMAKLSRTPWESLDHFDRARLKTAGWLPEEWDQLQRVQPELWRKTEMLTPAAILKTEGIEPALRDRMVSRLLGVISDESKFASPDPNLRTRTLQAGGHQRGTGRGELWRHLMLFKGFSFTQIFRHWDRALNGDMSPAGKVAYTSALVLAPTLFGGLSLLLTDLAAGRDPRDVTGDLGDDPARLVRFWGAALAKGGGLGFLGDMLLSGMGAHGQSGASAAVGGVAGPVVGSAFELVYDVGLENLMEAAQGKETHAGAEAFRWARGHVPGVNIWYLKLALDQAVLNQAQEFLSPGYLAKTRARAEKTWASTWWWEPTDTGVLSGDMTAPERAPTFESAAGAR